MLIIGIATAPNLPFTILYYGSVFVTDPVSSGMSRMKQWSSPTAKAMAKRNLFALGYIAKVRDVIDMLLIPFQNPGWMDF